MVLEDLDGRIDAVIDGGATTIGVESTIISLCGAPTLLRPGGVALEAIEALIGEVLLPAEAVLPEEQTQPAPGMLLKHYAGGLGGLACGVRNIKTFDTQWKFWQVQ